MSCSKPLLALDCGYKTGKNGDTVRAIKFLDMKFKYRDKSFEDMKNLFGDRLITLPCGHCYMCSLDYSRMWASRIVLESREHKQNSFITLTYAEGICPDVPSKRDWQLFMKRLRKEVGWPIRFFACGEKGEKTGRSHMHAIIFGYDFPDKVPLKRSGSGLIIYRSPTLERLWPYGISSIGEVSPDSAQYVAKYSLKRKMTGVDSGEWVLMSRRPGIGANGFDPKDYDTDRLYLNGQKFKIPRYFDKLAERYFPFDLWLAKTNREELAKQYSLKKYGLNIAHEEVALKKLEEDKIFDDVCKVRLSV